MALIHKSLTMQVVGFLIGMPSGHVDFSPPLPALSLQKLLQALRHFSEAQMFKLLANYPSNLPAPAHTHTQSEFQRAEIGLKCSLEGGSWSSSVCSEPGAAEAVWREVTRHPDLGGHGS